VKDQSARERFNWRLPVYTALAAIALGLLDTFGKSDSLLYLLPVVLVSLFLLLFLLFAAIGRKSSLCLAILSMLAVFWIFSFALFTNRYAIRNNMRWLLGSRRYKAEVLAQSAPPNGELKRVEWDGWGFPGAGNTYVYLVFDPTDSLAAAAKKHEPGKFDGISGKVLRVSRLEDRWYAVLFYTGQTWDAPNQPRALSITIPTAIPR
jgi:hypothetical protein